MEDKNGFQICLCYLKRHIKSLSLFGLFVILYAIVFSLYDLPVEAVGYGLLLCICIGSVLVGVDCFRYYKKHRLLQKLKQRVVLDAKGFPFPNDLIEQDYQELIDTLHREKTRLVSEADGAQSELVDYFTLWAHQIKTPIAAMRLLLQSETDGAEDALLAELFKIEQYVEMVLQYLRLDSTSSDFVFQYYELDDIIRQAVRKYAKLFVLKKLSLRYEPLQYKVLTDEKWLLFVIEQILSNALKYTKSGSISIYLESPATLVIEDTGIGIAKEDLPRIFEKGFTGYNGRTDKKSTGIGLYLSKRILSKLSHPITIESEIGKGTKVKINLESASLMVE